MILWSRCSTCFYSRLWTTIKIHFHKFLLDHRKWLSHLLPSLLFHLQLIFYFTIAHQRIIQKSAVSTTLITMTTITYMFHKPIFLSKYFLTLYLIFIVIRSHIALVPIWFKSIIIWLDGYQTFIEVLRIAGIMRIMYILSRPLSYKRGVVVHSLKLLV